MNAQVRPAQSEDALNLLRRKEAQGDAEGDAGESISNARVCQAVADMEEVCC